GHWRSGPICPTLDGTPTRSVSAARVFEGERITVTLTVTAGRPAPLLELFEPLPPALRLVGGHNRGLFNLRRGQSVEWRYEVECVRRGRVSFETVHARLWDRAGLHAGATSIPVPWPLGVAQTPLALVRLRVA